MLLSVIILVFIFTKFFIGDDEVMYIAFNFIFVLEIAFNEQLILSIDELPQRNKYFIYIFKS